MTPRTTAADLILVIPALSRRANVNGFDAVAHIPGGIPERLHRLRLPDTIDRAHVQVMSARRQADRGLPFSKRIFSEVLPERSLRPSLAAVAGQENIGYAVSAIERNAFEGRVGVRLDHRP